jgi:hypothetical protein
MTGTAMFVGEGPKGRQDLAGCVSPRNKAHIDKEPRRGDRGFAKWPAFLSPRRGSVIVKQSHRGFPSVTPGQVLPALRACMFRSSQFLTQAGLAFHFGRKRQQRMLRGAGSAGRPYFAGPSGLSSPFR